MRPKDSHYYPSLFISDDETFYVDWKNGSGSVGVGEPPIDKKPDVTFTLRKEWLMKVLNRKLQSIYFIMRAGCTKFQYIECLIKSQK